jgi:hypothetical protein
VPLQIEHAPFRVTSSRPVALPKTQAKYIEAFYFVPRDSASSSDGRYWLQRRLVPKSGARREILDQQPCLAMPDFQFNFVVLADIPDRYAFLKRLHCVTPPEMQFVEEEQSSIQYYRVSIPKNMLRGVPLPTHPMAWTSTAYVLWDNIFPNLLTPAQQQAMIDWLHWGGQLVISGPGSLERLKGSFLEPYLPASSAGAVELKSTDFDELNANWSLRLTKDGEQQLFPINENESVFAVDLKPVNNGSFSDGCGRLACEGPVGSGRIVVTAFALTDRHALGWKCYDGFFNGCLLHRPSRQFKPGAYTGEVELVWAKFPSLVRDPELVSRLRYFSRDAADPAMAGDKPSGVGAVATDSARASWRLTGYEGQDQAGVAGWNDFGSVSSAARNTLKQAAGITIPESSFVLKVLAGYLALLVPLNWCVFKLLGRVEWAWIAAPIMGIGASIAVVHMAQLDIGFARSRTEVATMEIHAGYSRAHLARYTALYTSLTTNYVVDSESDSALILPFSTDPKFVPRIHDTVTSVALRRDRTVHLSGFPVISNSTGIVHSEQMYDIGGVMQIVQTPSGDLQLANSSDISIQDAVVLRRDGQGNLTVARLGTVQSKAKVPLQFETTGDVTKLADLWPDSPTLSGRDRKPGDVGLEQLADVAILQLPIRSGETRLVGWSDQSWKGFVIRPEANQTVTRTLILVHLEHGPLPAAERDENLFIDIAPTNAQQALTDEEVEPEEGLKVLPQDNN